MQNIGQTTAVQFGNALDPRGRANHPKPASARAHGNQVGTVLAKDQSVWSSRNIYTLITSHTPQFRRRWLKQRSRRLASQIVVKFSHAAGFIKPDLRRIDFSGNSINYAFN